MKIKILLAVLLATLIISLQFSSCNDPVEPPYLSPIESYYPLEIGSSITYEVDSINYNEIVPNDTGYWLVKETLTDTFYDLNNNLNYIIERYQKQTDTAAWQLVNVWNVLMVDGQIQKVENNLRFIKMTTPVSENSTWDGNIYLGGLDDIPVAQDCNNLSFYEDWNYSYTNVDEPYVINGFDFNESVTVIQEGDSNLIWYDYAREVYGKGVGLIEKEFYHFYTQDLSCPDCPWTERVQCGYSVKMRLIDYTR